MELINKYNIGDRVKTKIHFRNDSRTEVEAEIRGVELDEDDKIKYKIRFECEESYDKQICTGCTGYVYQDDVIELCK